VDSSGITKEKLLLDLCHYLNEEGYGDIEVFFKENNIKISQIDSYVYDADDKGYSEHTIYKVELKEPFYFIHEWYGGKWESLGSAVYIAEAYQATRYKIISDDFRDKYNEGLYDWMDAND
jgi:hypothetical protein